LPTITCSPHFTSNKRIKGTTAKSTCPKWIFNSLIAILRGK
jgi:hypothetical protein